MTTRLTSPRLRTLAACAWLLLAVGCGSSDDNGGAVDASVLRDANPDGPDGSVIDAAAGNDGHDALDDDAEAEVKADAAMVSVDANSDGLMPDVMLSVDAPGQLDAEPLPRLPTISLVPATCPKNDIEIAFAPMFTAFDGAHTFQVPAIVVGLPPRSITWSSSDPALIGLQIDFTTGGILITALKAGVVDIVATAGALCGSAHLTINATNPDVWEMGNTLFNRDFTMGPGAGADGGTTGPIACTNCHGPLASLGPFRTLTPTPEQTGGFSPAQLIGILNGVWPDASGVPLDTTITSRRTWELFHRWNLTDSQASALVVYLRSLTPVAQSKARNFGGRPPGGALATP